MVSTQLHAIYTKNGVRKPLCLWSKFTLFMVLLYSLPWFCVIMSACCLLACPGNIYVIFDSYPAPDIRPNRHIVTEIATWRIIENELFRFLFNTSTRWQVWAWKAQRQVLNYRLINSFARGKIILSVKKGNHILKSIRSLVHFLMDNLVHVLRSVIFIFILFYIIWSSLDNQFWIWLVL